LDVSYFTSLSYYIALLFATRGIFSLVFMEGTVDETEMMRRQMNPMGQAAGEGWRPDLSCITRVFLMFL
jgi:hypothetical protein